MKQKEKDKIEAVRILKEWGLKNKKVVYAKVTHVSASGMSRRVQLFISVKNELINISYWAARALEWGYKDGYAGGIAVSGCGMDMLFHTVYSLSYAMGYGALKQRSDDKSGLQYKSI